MFPPNKINLKKISYSHKNLIWQNNDKINEFALKTTNCTNIIFANFKKIN